MDQKTQHRHPGDRRTLRRKRKNTQAARVSLARMRSNANTAKTKGRSRHVCERQSGATMHKTHAYLNEQSPMHTPPNKERKSDTDMLSLCPAKGTTDRNILGRCRRSTEQCKRKPSRRNGRPKRTLGWRTHQPQRNQLETHM